MTIATGGNLKLGVMTPFIVPALAAALFLASLFSHGALDLALARTAAGWRTQASWLVGPTALLTNLGSGIVTLGLAALAGFWLLLRGQPRRALTLIGGALVVRLAVEGFKAAFARPRPVFPPQVEHLASYSFPSGHSANSMATYVLLAGMLAAGRKRPPALAAGFALALAIGTTRVILGVHWPSDVVGGWSLGLAGAITALAIDRRSAPPQ